MPITCTPCFVKIEDATFFVAKDGAVYPITMEQRMSPLFRDALRKNGRPMNADPLQDEQAKVVRQEASRLRRNRAARERNQAMRDLGMKKTRYGWE